MKGKITICKINTGEVILTVEDVKSGITFLDLNMDLTNFSNALFGLGNVNCEFNLRGSENVGKTLIKEAYTFLVKDSNRYNREEKALKEIKNLNEQDPIWSYTTYVGSQNSFSPDPETQQWYCNIYRFRYEE